MKTFLTSKLENRNTQQITEKFPEPIEGTAYDRACALVTVWATLIPFTMELMVANGKTLREDHPAPTDLAELYDWSQRIQKTEVKLMVHIGDVLTEKLLATYGMGLDEAKSIIAKKTLVA